MTTRIVDTALLEQIRRLPCMACVDSDPLAALEAIKAGESGGPRSHPHHLRSRGAGGDDTPENVMPLCHVHHREVHAKGLNRFAETYVAVCLWLSEAGWTFDITLWKWRR